MDYKGNIWMAVITLTLGIALIFMRSVVASTIVVILGTMFVASGGLNILFQLTRRNDKGKLNITFSSFITSLAAVILGIWMICDPNGNIKLVITLLGIMTAIGGGYHIFSMLFTYKQVKFPLWFYVLPALILGCGVFMICSPLTFVSSLVLIAGIILIVYSIATMIEIAAIMSFQKGARNYSDTAYVEEDDDRSEPKEIGQGKGPWPSDRR